MREKFGFERLPDFDPGIWNKIKKSGMKKIKTLRPGFISGSDIDAEVVKTAQQNCTVPDKQEIISIKQADIFKIRKLENTTIVCNPPYGLRLNKNTDLSGFYKQVGDFLKQRCNGSTAYIYFGDRKYLKHIGLRSSWKKPLTNGGLDGRLAKFEMY